MSTTIRNIILGTVIATLVIALAAVALPFKSVFAASEAATATPPASAVTDPTTINARLELAFSREKMIVSRIGQEITNYDLVTSNVQKLLDKAKSNGKDVTAIQTAFDAFKTAFVAAKPIYDHANTILASQGGFDNNGKVIDIVKAKAEVKSLRNTLLQYKNEVKTARQTLRDTVQTFRLANPKNNAAPGQKNSNP